VEEGVHQRWQQWQTKVAWRGDNLRRRKERRVFIDGADRGEAVRVHVSTRGHGMGAEAVATCGGAPANGGACVRAPVSARRPRGTGLGGWRASPPLGAQCPQRTASDRLVFWLFGVRACPYGDDAVVAWHGATSRMLWLPTVQSDPVRLKFSQNFATKVLSTKNTKLVDLAPLYNFCKG
jgi:hypothetical protein